MSDPMQGKENKISPEAQRIRDLEHEVAMLTNAGVIECMVRNKSVAEYIAELEAKIDALMLEYCPDEMTPEQIENWGKHQRRVSPERTAEIDRAIALQEEA